MPVVTPNRRSASMLTVNAVASSSLFRSVICGRPSWSHRSPVRARQMRPRPCRVMKLMVSGVTSSAAQTRSPSFSRSSSSATMTILPFRRSSIACSMVPKVFMLFPALTATPRTSRSCRPRGAPGRRGVDRASVVCSKVNGISEIWIVPGAGTAFTVRLTPSTVTEPSGTETRATSGGASRSRIRTPSAASTRSTVPTPST